MERGRRFKAVQKELNGFIAQQLTAVQGCLEVGMVREGTRYTVSPATLKLSRLVARICRRGHSRKSVSAIKAQAEIRCSQLSRMSSNDLERNEWMRVSVRGDPASSFTFSAEHRAWGTRDGSDSVVRSTYAAPSR
jgi:hypothetical protein